MHIEPGLVAPAKVMMANVAAVGVIAFGLKEQLKALRTDLWAPVKTLAAALFFSLFMQSYHVSVGPSELHFIGAMAMYLTLGFTPTLLGFGVGLVFQGLLFEPGDLPHLAVNSLSLMLPLISVHYAMGRKLFDQSVRQRLSWTRIVKLDAAYYAGVTAMVGFWLAIGNEATPFADWLAFASSYLALVVLEPVVTLIAVKGLKKLEGNSVVANLFVVNRLTVA